MTMNSKLQSLTQRKGDLTRELADLAESKHETENSALADLEKALMAELDSIEKQIGQIRTYQEQCESNATPAHP